MEQRQPARRKSFVVVIWLVSQTETATRWYGSLETLDGQRFYFHTLADLNRVIRDVGGWQEPPEQTHSTDEK